MTHDSPLWSYRPRGERTAEELRRFDAATTAAAETLRRNRSGVGRMAASQDLDEARSQRPTLDRRARRTRATGERAAEILRERRSQGGGGGGGFLGGAADAFRAAVPNPVRDILGGTIRSQIRALQTGVEAIDRPRGAVTGALSGRDAVESTQRLFQGFVDPGRFSGRDALGVRLLPEDSKVRAFAGAVAEEVTDPLNILIAAKGGVLAVKAANKFGKAGKIGAKFFEPLSPDKPFAVKLAGETVLGGTARAGGAFAYTQTEDLPEPLRVVSALAAGLISGGISGQAFEGGVRATSAVRSAARMGVDPDFAGPLRGVPIAGGAEEPPHRILFAQDPEKAEDWWHLRDPEGLESFEVGKTAVNSLIKKTTDEHIFVSTKPRVWSDGFMAEFDKVPGQVNNKNVEPIPEGKIDFALAPGEVDVLRPLAARVTTGAGARYSVIFETPSGGRIFIDARYYQYFRSKYPDAEFRFAKDAEAPKAPGTLAEDRAASDNPVFVFSKGRQVGAISPMQADYARLDEALRVFAGEDFTPRPVRDLPPARKVKRFRLAAVFTKGAAGDFREGGRRLEALRARRAEVGKKPELTISERGIEERVPEPEVEEAVPAAAARPEAQRRVTVSTTEEEISMTVGAAERRLTELEGDLQPRVQEEGVDAAALVEDEIRALRDALGVRPEAAGTVAGDADARTRGGTLVGDLPAADAGQLEQLRRARTLDNNRTASRTLDVIERKLQDVGKSLTKDEERFLLDKANEAGPGATGGPAAPEPERPVVRIAEGVITPTAEAQPVREPVAEPEPVRLETTPVEPAAREFRTTVSSEDPAAATRARADLESRGVEVAPDVIDVPARPVEPPEPPPELLTPRELPGGPAEPPPPIDVGRTGGGEPPSGRPGKQPELGFKGADEANERWDAGFLQPGPFSRAVMAMPIIRNFSMVLNPALALDRRIAVAYGARRALGAALEGHMRREGRQHIIAIEEAWNDQAPRYIGPKDNPGAGTIPDLGTNPRFYEGVSETLRQALNDYRDLGFREIRMAREQYGVDWLPFVGEDPDFVYFPTVDATVDTLEALKQTVRSSGTNGRGKRRLYETPYERWQAAKARGKDFEWEHNPTTLMENRASSLAQVSARNAFIRGTDGKTRVEALDETHPGLRQARDEMAARLQSIKGRLSTAEQRVGITGNEERKIAGEQTRIEKRAEPMVERVEELSEAEGWGAELSFLSGQVRELQLRHRQLASRRATVATRGRVQRDTLDALEAELDQLGPQLDQIRAAYNNANLGPEFVLNRQTFRYHDPEQSRQIDKVLADNSDFDGVFSVADEIRAWVLNGDASLVTLQLQFSILMDPRTAWKRKDDIFRLMRDPDALQARLLEEGEAVRDFEFDTGYSMTELRGFEEQGSLRSRGPERIPALGQKIKDFNDTAWRATLWMVYQQYKLDRETILRFHPDMPKEIAGRHAAVALSRVVPRLNPAESGRSVRRARLERSLLTSPSFFASPVLMVRDAASAMAKMGMAAGTGQGMREAPTPRELMSLYRLANFGGTVFGMAVTSALVSSQFNELSPQEAIAEVIDPRSGRFLSIVIGDQGTVGIGGPLRGFLRAMAPRRDDEGEWEWPLPGLKAYLRGRVHPAVSGVMEQFTKQDYFGNDIEEGVFNNRLLNRAAYAFENVVPLTIAEVLEGARTGQSVKEISFEIAGQLAGQNLYARRPIEELDRITRARFPDVNQFFELPRKDQQALKEEFPGLWRVVVERGSDERKELEVKKEVLRDQQFMDDDSLVTGKLTREEWREEYYRRQDDLRLTARAIFGDDEEDLTLSEVNDLATSENPFTAYIGAISLFTDHTGRVDWEAVENWRTELPADQQTFIDENTGVDRTPLGRVYREIAKVRGDYYDLAAYRGFSAKEGRAIDEFWQEVRNRAPSTEERAMRRSYSQTVLDDALIQLVLERHSGVDEERMLEGVRRRIVQRKGRSLLRRSGERERFAQQHPEMNLFFGRGRLTTQERSVLGNLIDDQIREFESVALPEAGG